jgi:hypothetical protein
MNVELAAQTGEMTSYLCRIKIWKSAIIIWSQFEGKRRCCESNSIPLISFRHAAIRLPNLGTHLEIHHDTENTGGLPLHTTSSPPVVLNSGHINLSSGNPNMILSSSQ